MVEDMLQIRILGQPVYQIPVHVRVFDNGVNFQDTFVDMGVLTNPNISNHQYTVSVSNEAST
jgi:hypothetical protein